MPASRSMRATTRSPRSWPSSPSLASTTRICWSAVRPRSVRCRCRTPRPARPRSLLGGVGTHGVEDRGHQVDGGIGGVGPHPGERDPNHLVVPILLHPGQALALELLDLGVDAQQVLLALVVPLGERVDADDDPLTGVDLALEPVGRLGDLPDEPAVVDPGVDALEHRPVAELLEVGEDLLGLPLHLVGHPLDVRGAAEGVGDVGDAGLVGHDLLGAQGRCGPPSRWAGRAPRRRSRCGGTGCRRARPRAPGCATRAMLFSGCWAVSDTPAVWVWNRSFQDRSSTAP
jgi:hypothetical protein